MSSRGPALLRRFLKNGGGQRITLETAAKALEVSKTAVIYWLEGAQRPRDAMREAIEKWTSGAVPADSWLAPGETRPVDRVRPFTPPEPEAA